MSNIDQFSVVTLIFSLLSTVFVIKPFSFHVPVPMLGRQKVTLALIAAPIIALCILWAFQFIGATQIRDGIIGTDNVKPYNIFIPFISLAYMALTLDVTGILQSAAFWVRNMGRRNGRILFFCFYLLLTSISMVIGNDPVILFVTVANLDPLAWLTPDVAAANTASTVLFFGNSTHIVICEGFQVNKTVFLVQYTVVAESLNPCTVPMLLISLGYMLAMFDDTGIRESAASSLISTSGRTRLFLYLYLLLVCGSVVFGKDPIILTFLVAVAWLMSGFAASNTTNEHMVGTFYGVKSVTVNGGTFTTNHHRHVPAQASP